MQNGVSYPIFEICEEYTKRSLSKNLELRLNEISYSMLMY